MLSTDQIEHLVQLGVVSSAVSLLILWLPLCAGYMEGYMIALTLWGIAAARYIYRDNQKVLSSNRTVFVSGCDSGFGLELALQLHKLGFRVLAGCLHAESDSGGAALLRQENSERLVVLQLDVTDPVQVQQTAQQAKHLLQEDGLWCLVNNAGVNQVGAVEWVPLQSYRTTMEVNLLGTIALTKALLPLIRKSKGRIITVSSAVGDLPSPLMSPYVASKHAIEGFSDCLRLEMKQWGVDVILVEPGNFNAGTGILTVDKVRTQIEGMWSSMNDEVKSAYGEQSLKTLFSRWAQKEIEGDDDISTEKKKSDSEYKKLEDDIETDSNNNIELPKSPDITPVIDALSSAVIQQWPYACYRPMDVRLRLKQAIAQHMPYSVFEAIYYTR